MHILITGSNGQVGNELQAIANEFPDFTFVLTDYLELDITDATAVNDFFEINKFDACLNCAAYTAVDKAETEPDRAIAINVTGAANLARACASHGAYMIHISTDYVYHNNHQNSPFVETDTTSPQGVYAQTKLDGDLAVLDALPDRSIVLRTSWVYSSFGHNFVKTMLKLGAERTELRVIYDQIGTPTYARDLARAMLTILQKVGNGSVSPETIRGQIYHYSNEGVGSWYDFTRAIFYLANITTCNVLPIRTAEYPTPAQRPPFSLLDKSKIKATFGIQIPYWVSSVRECVNLLK